MGFTFTFSLIIFLSVFGPVERNSQWAKVFSFIAAATQLVSQMLPLHTAVGKFDIKNSSYCHKCHLTFILFAVPTLLAC